MRQLLHLGTTSSSFDNLINLHAHRSPDTQIPGAQRKSVGQSPLRRQRAPGGSVHPCSTTCPSNTSKTLHSSTDTSPYHDLLNRSPEDPSRTVRTDACVARQTQVFYTNTSRRTAKMQRPQEPPTHLYDFRDFACALRPL